MNNPGIFILERIKAFHMHMWNFNGTQEDSIT